jgi:hypothetical protein
MKNLFCTLLLATLSVAAAKADVVTITFDHPNQLASPGETLQFFGTITNDSNTTVFLNNDDLNLSGLSLTTTDQFLNTVPISLAPSGQPGDSSGDIELFDVTVSNPLLDAQATYSGSYTLFGGIDGNAQDNLGSTPFSVTTTPEPSAIYLVLAAFLTILVPLSRKARRQA